MELIGESRSVKNVVSCEGRLFIGKIIIVRVMRGGGEDYEKME